MKMDIYLVLPNATLHDLSRSTELYTIFVSLKFIVKMI